ncbi:Glutathione S-transferase GST-6.0 [Raoultella terrigena]|uniref:Glutathione S-transferase GST-6.0 n=1 Tax=Raoultella terrigena TaxID=577 RepID=A0A4U9CZP4_RAOTE|nr:Glutathione S-transferase GST-6.0 [Raoultella terrigena]
MKLYYSPGSCSLSPHIALREAGLDFELIRVDTKTHTWGAGNNYYDINPLGYVPALETADGDIFREGVTLIQYIADLAPDAGLAPASGTLARYRLEEWLVFFNSEIHKAFIPLFYSEHGGAYINIAREKLLSRLRGSTSSWRIKYLSPGRSSRLPMAICSRWLAGRRRSG